jgi:L-lactate dehydrogenase complex protein LldG
MSETKKVVLTRIRQALHRQALSPDEQNSLATSMKQHSRGIIPQLTIPSLMESFITAATTAAAVVTQVATINEIPSALLHLHQQHHLQHPISVASQLKTLIPWQTQSELIIQFDANPAADAIAVTGCLCGVAETGTLVLVSSPKSPTLLNFLPQIHVVLLPTEKIVAVYEDAWDLVRQMDAMPRTVNFITGPSRTGDIEQKILLGVHGPKALYIILYNEGKSHGY